MTTPSSPNSQVRRRADAQQNYELLLAAADSMFTEHGADASLEDIARRAGVGIGTLYRHFPTRDDLIAKVLDQGTDVVVARGRKLLVGGSPAKQLAIWIRELVTYVTTYRGLTAAIANSYVNNANTQLCVNCNRISDVGGELLARAQAAGEIREDVDVREVILSAHSAAWIAEQTNDPTAVDRLLRILFDGLQSSASRSSAPRSPRSARASTPPRRPAAPSSRRTRPAR